MKYLDLLNNIIQFTRSDGVHLTEKGYKLFLNNIKGNKNIFVYKWEVFPNQFRLSEIILGRLFCCPFPPKQCGMTVISSVHNCVCMIF